jgi:hypothetical protein
LLNPAHIATIGFAWLLVKIAPDTLAGASDPAGRTAALAIVGGLTLGLLWTPVVVWWSTRPDRLPPRSDITKACDFSGNVAEFESERHIYALRNKTFADALAAANPDRVWTAGDQKRMRSRTAIISAVLLAALLVARLLMWYFTGK